MHSIRYSSFLSMMSGGGGGCSQSLNVLGASGPNLKCEKQGFLDEGVDELVGGVMTNWRYKLWKKLSQMRTWSIDDWLTPCTCSHHNTPSIRG